MTGWAWFWKSQMMVAFWSLVVFAIYALVRAARGESRSETTDEILARRYARGEISREEYEESRRLLAS
jgi:putative membrane protein